MTSVSDRLVVRVPTVLPSSPPEPVTNASEGLPNPAAGTQDVTVSLPSAGIASVDPAPPTEVGAVGAAAVTDFAVRPPADGLLGISPPDGAGLAISLSDAVREIMGQRGADQVTSARTATETDQHLDGSVVSMDIVNDEPEAPRVLASATPGDARLAPDVTGKRDADAATDGESHRQTEPSNHLDQALKSPGAQTKSAAMAEPEPTALVMTGSSATLAEDIPGDWGPLSDDGRSDQSGPATSGIAASSILNAAMIPGWPQPPRLEGVAAEPGLMQMQPPASMTDDEMLTYIANLGADPAMLDKARKALKRPVVGRKLVYYMTVMSTALSVVFQALAEELAAMEAEQAIETEGRDRAKARGRKTRRHLLFIE